MITSKTKNSGTRVKVKTDLPEALRSGGENMPLDFPHLYQIQAGDWRISYAVEHNRLAILVLEVLTGEGSSQETKAHENMNKKMKIKLLDLPVAGHEMAPEDVGKRLKIKVLDIPEAAATDDEIEGEVTDIRENSKEAPSQPTDDPILEGTEPETAAGKPRLKFLDLPGTVLDEGATAEKEPRIRIVDLAEDEQPKGEHKPKIKVLTRVR